MWTWGMETTQDVQVHNRLRVPFHPVSGPSKPGSGSESYGHSGISESDVFGLNVDEFDVLLYNALEHSIFACLDIVYDYGESSKAIIDILCFTMLAQAKV